MPSLIMTYLASITNKQVSHKKDVIFDVMELLP